MNPNDLSCWAGDEHGTDNYEDNGQGKEAAFLEDISHVALPKQLDNKFY